MLRSFLLLSLLSFVVPLGADPAIDAALSRLETLLQEENPRDIASVFSPDYPQGMEALQRHLSIVWTQERLLQLRFVVEDYGLTDDGRARVAVRWFKTYIDEDERPRRSGGSSIIHYGQTGDSRLIEAIEGDRFF
ncbi:MAG: hypothetical protein KDH88_11175 [Chromatiales bacterium]|nr:hypothetical protein [Chromatiales bacterium]